jgi:chitinase
MQPGPVPKRQTTTDYGLDEDDSRNNSSNSNGAVNVQQQQQQQQHQYNKRTMTRGENWGRAHISIPLNVNYLDGDWAQYDPATFKTRYKYQRDASECAGQVIYIIEAGFEQDNAAFALVKRWGQIETLPRQQYGLWDGKLASATGDDHATGVASIAAGDLNGVCPGGAFTLVGTSFYSTLWRNTDKKCVAASNYLHLEALVAALRDIKAKNRATRSVVNMSWSITDGIEAGILAALLKEFDKLGVVMVTVAGNHAKTSGPQIDRYPALWAGDGTLPNLIVVGASDELGRQAGFSQTGPALTVHAPGDRVTVASLGGALVEDSGTSFAAPAVAALVAYWRAINPGDGRLDQPGPVKAMVRRMRRRVLVHPPPGSPHWQSAEDPVPVVWNGQRSDMVECLFQGVGSADCPEVWKDQPRLDDLLCPNPAAGIKRKRQAGAGGVACELNPPGGGSPGGGGDGGDGGGQDQLGPSKTFTYLRGTPSPTCTSGCGTLCTGYWCRPDQTGQPPHFTEPTRLPTTTLPPINGGGQPCPDGAVAHTSTACVGSGGRVVCGPVTSCFDLPALPPPTSCAMSTTSTRCVGSGGRLVCGVETVCVTPPPLPAPTACTGGWVASTVDFCVGSGGRQVCGQSAFCVTAPSASPTYRLVDNAKCPGSGEVCVRKKVVTSCANAKARDAPLTEPTLPPAAFAFPAVAGGDSVPTSSTSNAPPLTTLPAPRGAAAASAVPMPVQVARNPPVIKPPRRPIPGRSLRQIHELQVSPVPAPAAVAAASKEEEKAVSLVARQQVCNIMVTCETCQKPPTKPSVPDPCIEIKMLAVATGLGGTQISAELSLNGRIVCRPSNLCGVDERVEDCWGADDFDCGGGGNRLDWRGEFFSLYVKANDKTYDVEVKVTKEGVYDPCGSECCPPRPFHFLFVSFDFDFPSPYLLAFSHPIVT